MLNAAGQAAMTVWRKKEYYYLSWNVVSASNCEYFE